MAVSRVDPRPRLDKGNQFAKPPYTAAVDGLTTQTAPVPGLTKLLGIEGVKLVLHLQQPAAEGTRVPFLLGVLPSLAGVFDALQVS